MVTFGLSRRRAEGQLARRWAWIGGAPVHCRFPGDLVPAMVV